MFLSLCHVAPLHTWNVKHAYTSMQHTNNAARPIMHVDNTKVTVLAFQ